MRNPTNVLKSLSEKSRDPQYKFERLYRNLHNSEFYLTAYKNIAQSQGSMTPGVDGKTLSNMSMGRIQKLINSLKDHSYKPNPVRREYIKKKSNPSKKRPLGISSTDDKLVQEVVRMILESIYEPIFSASSHGFRPNRSCHTALSHLQSTFTGVKWFVEGDIKACFDSFDHHILINLLRKRIKDEYFISLMWKFLKAGYMEQWEYHHTYSGCPQGSGISPILANIYLNELDNFMDEYKKSFDVGDVKTRKRDITYTRAFNATSKVKRTYKDQWASMDKQERKLAAKHLKSMRMKSLKLNVCPVFDKEYRRIQYIRYADDFLVGIIGSKNKAEKVKADIRSFLAKQLKLEMSDEKTKITHSSDFARFLAHDVTVSRDDCFKYNVDNVPMRIYSNVVKLYVPHDKWVNKLKEYEAFKIETVDGKETWKPLHRGYLINREDIDIIGRYNSEIRGLYNFYRLANNVSVLNKFSYIMEYSMYKTFGRKYEMSVKKVIAKYSQSGEFGIDYSVKSGTRRCTFCKPGFIRQTMPLKDYTDILPQYIKYEKPNSLATRLKAGKCEMCGAPTDDLRMHHVKRLKDLTGATQMERLMIQKRRKSLALCPTCFENHVEIN